MELKKIGLLCGAGKQYSGAIEAVTIGVPKEILSPSKNNTYLINFCNVLAGLPKRSINAHKQSVGKIFVLAGSPGLTGAAYMTAQTAMKAGAGAVILGTPNSVYPILSRKLTEVMVDALDDNSEGAVSLNAFDKIQEHIRWADIVVLGPGLSRNPETMELVRKIFSKCEKRMLIDADGLSALSEDVSLFKKRTSKEVILTPHTGELSRLINRTADEIEKNRVEIAREHAKKMNVTLILKGAPTVTASAQGDMFINSTGNPGMATAGSGDVLSGVIAGLWGQNMNSLEAAWSGVFIHGKAGDMAKNILGEKSLLATDIMEHIPNVLRDFEKENR